MVKAIALLLLALFLMTVFAPIVFIGQTVRTAYFAIIRTGFKQAWVDVAEYFTMVAVDGLDQLGATILYKVRDLTVSSYTFILCKNNKACKFEKVINLFFGKLHCKQSAQNELIEFKDKVKILEKGVQG